MLQDIQDAATWQGVVDSTIGAVLLDVADYLGTRDVAAWQAVNVETKNVFDMCYESGTVWQNCAESQIPQFLVADEFYEGEDRQRFLRCHSLLLQANRAPASMLIMNTIDQVSFLERQLRSALTYSRASHSPSRRDVHLLVGNFQLRRSATGTRFEFGVDDMPTIAGLPEGVLKMSMFFNNRELVTCAEYATGHGFPFEPYMPAKRMQFKLNVWSADSNLCFEHHGITLILDGAKRASSLGASTGTPFNTGVCLTDPVLCVLTLTEDDCGLEAL
eukprot:TRINITY_DN19020_c0_g2_i1.p1 TRINITY_DN19020_c0_g2~~TRINITY_DN19020_c0_g2_i1.p1  ORF type:complete len:274 (-),score=26.84 TRINITY_DN19020_c0_g2_i1:420-1241(-)